MTTVLHLPLQQEKISLREDCPLYPLMLAFPDGIPVKPYILSLNDEDFYEFCPSQIPNQRVLIDLTHGLTQCPEKVHYAFARHHVIAIPCEWVEVTS